MINRILLRIKVIQLLYSYYKNNAQEENSVEDAQKELILSINKTYELYHFLLLLINEITNYATEKSRKKKKDGEDDVCIKFTKNLFAEQIKNNKQLNEFVEENEIEWPSENKGTLIKDLYNQIVETEEFKQYASEEDQTYEKDKEIWRTIFKKTISDSDLLGKELEDISIYWNDDAEVVISFILKTIRKFEEKNGADQPLLPKFKDKEDEVFAMDLFKKTIYGEHEYRDMISTHTKNWESDRIAFLDTIIMQTALAEICNFPSIPVNVTMNEYIEIAKDYSTLKSGNFINGILDAIVKELKENNKLVKVAYINSYKK